MSKREELRKLAEGKVNLEDRLVAEGIFTREEIEQVRVKHRAMLDQTVPFGNGARLKPLNRTPNHAVGECYKPHSELNTHDPDNLHAWEPEPVSAWVWVGRALFCLGLCAGMYCIGFLLGVLL